MDEDGSRSFFTRLRMLCRQVDQDLRVLKEDFNVPPGSAPQFYDRGLNALKNEFKDIRTMNEEGKKVQRSVENFSYWLQSMQELVNKQGDDINKIEKYLVKFGYVPIEKPSTLMPTMTFESPTANEKENVSDSKKIEEVSESKNIEASSNVKNPPPSKPFKDVNMKQNVQGKETAVHNSSAKPVKSASEATYYRTPKSTKTFSSQYTKESAQTGTVQSSGYGSRSVTVEQWLDGVQSGSPVITPYILQSKRLLMRERQEMDITISCRNLPSSVKKILPSSEPNKNSENPESDNDQLLKVPRTPIGNVPATEHSLNINGTPVEPELSEYTTQFLIMKPSSVSKGKTSMSSSLLKEVHMRNAEKDPHSLEMIKEESMRTHIPKEPLHSSLQENNFSHQTTDVTSSMSLSQVGSETPEEPILTHPIPRAVSKDQAKSRTPEEPVLSYQMEQISRVVKMRTPEEPILSIQLPEHSSITCDDDSKTPEEPVLFYQLPENIAASKLKVQTPEEPQLSCRYQKSGSVTSQDDKTPEAPVLSSYASAMQSMQTCANSLSQASNQRDIPASPELSDVTQSFLSLRNQSCVQDRLVGVKNHHTPTSIKQESYHESNRMQFSRNEKLLPHSSHQTETMSMQENFPQRGTERMDNKRKWYRPGIAMEKFLGVDVDDVPPSPQLSETTQRMFARMY